MRFTFSTAALVVAALLAHSAGTAFPRTPPTASTPPILPRSGPASPCSTSRPMPRWCASRHRTTRRLPRPRGSPTRASTGPTDGAIGAGLTAALVLAAVGVRDVRPPSPVDDRVRETSCTD